MSSKKTMLITVYADNIEGQLRVTAVNEDEALKVVQKLGFKVKSMYQDFGLKIDLSKRLF